MALDYTSVIQQLYVSYFGRPADAGGLMSFQAQLAAIDTAGAITSIDALNAAVNAGKNPALNALVNSFDTSAESVSLYGNIPATGATYTQLANFVNSIYLNVLGRAADTAGGTFWINAIQTGSVTLADAALSITQGAMTNTSAQGLIDAATVANKLATANDFTTSLKNSPTLTLAAAYSGNAAAAAGRAMLAGITNTTTVVAQQNAALALDTQLVNGLTPTTFTLTTGIDSAGQGAFATASPAGNAVINGVIGFAGASDAATTFNVLDHVVATGLNNTLNVFDQHTGATALAGVTVSGVQTVNIEDAGTVGVVAGTAVDVSGWTGLTALNVTQSLGGDNLIAAATTSVTVTDTAAAIAGSVSVVGGNNVTVTENGSGTHYGTVNVDGSAGTVTVNQNTAGNVYVGYNEATDGAVTGAVVVNDTAFNGQNIYVYTGTNVTVNATNAQNSAYIQVGNGSAATNPTGTVTVTETNAATTQTNTSVSGGQTDIYGGTVINVTEHAAASASAATGASGETSTQGDVYVYNQLASTIGTITSVTVTQDAAVTGNGYTAATPAVAATTAANDVSALATPVGGPTYTYKGLTFTPYGAVTAAQIDAAFSNIVNGAYQGNSVLGTYSGQFTGVALGAVTTTAAGSTVLETTVAAQAAVAATSGVQSVNAGQVNVYDAVAYSATGTDTIASATITNANHVNIESTALTNLSVTNDSGQIYLSNGGHAATVKNTVTTTLNLTVNGDSGALWDANNQYKTLNITTAGADSVMQNSTIAAVTALTVAGTNAVDLTGASITALKSVVVSGSAGLTLNADNANVTSVNTSATSGSNTITINNATTYVGGSGGDIVTLGTVSASGDAKAITLGAGNDTVILALGTVTDAGGINGGAGTNTLQMVASDAVTDSGSTLFATEVTNFSVLDLTGGTGAQTVHLGVLGGFNSVITGGEAAGGVLTLDGFTSGGSLTLNAASTGSYVASNAAWTGAAPAALFNINLTDGAFVAHAATFGTVTASNVTAINISASDTTAHVKAGVDTESLTLVDTAATSITVTGNANLNLTSANSNVSTVDAHAMTGGLIYMTAGVVAETVTGGAGNNVLTAALGTVGDTLTAGAGADVLTSNSGLDILNGGAGNDTFVIKVSTNVNSYATINNAHVGDMISFGSVGVAGMVAFSQTQVALAPTAVFQDYANAAVHATATAAGDVAWFQFGGNTYVVEHNVVGAETSFTNGTDAIVKITGAVDLSHTSLSTSHNTLLIG